LVPVIYLRRKVLVTEETMPFSYWHNTCRAPKEAEGKVRKPERKLKLCFLQ
jgi:hypothetical protein